LLVPFEVKVSTVRDTCEILGETEGDSRADFEDGALGHVHSVHVEIIFDLVGLDKLPQSQAAALAAVARFRFALTRYRPAEKACRRAPSANVAKHSASTKWSSEAPKYCHSAAVGPG